MTAVDAKYEEAKGTSMTLPASTSSANDPSGSTPTPQPRKSRKEGRQTAQAPPGPAASSQKEFSQQSDRANALQNMLQNQYVEQHSAQDSTARVPQSSYNSGGQWQKLANPMLMEQMSSGNQ